MIDLIIQNLLNDPAFFILSIITLWGALGVILEQNIIRAGFSLVICFAGIAGTYFALQAPFVGASQILIYGVGITLVIVFALMLTSLKQDFPKMNGEIPKNLFSALLSFGIFLSFTYALTGNKWLVKEITSCPKNTEVIGLRMLGVYALPFELISILLLVALIGAIVVAKKDYPRKTETKKGQ